jgi:hypothetical protein
MYRLSMGVTLLLALAIIAIGVRYVRSPKIITPNFGPPLPEEGTDIARRLRLKGERDIASGLPALSMIAWGTPRVVGIIARGIA